MKDVLKLQQKIVPELIEVLEKRYNILRTIYYNGPIGRRILSSELKIGERVVRTEINFLKSQNLIAINSPGMTVTEEGIEVLEKLKSFIYELRGLSELETTLKDELGIKKVVIVPGNIDEDHSIMQDLGKAAANYVKSIMKDKSIITLTGGTTMREVVDNFPESGSYKNVLILPARGGMGRNVETQANTLAGKLANKMGSNYKMLHVPDNISDDVMAMMLKEDYIRDTVANIKKADILIYGIGNAESMCVKRSMSSKKTEEILACGAVGEAFGCYFSQDGKIVHSISSIGITVGDTKNIEHLIAVAGGIYKAKAIVAAELNNEKGILFTDEGAARKMLELLNEQNKS